MKTYARITAALLVAIGGLDCAHAAIQINGTRVIYPAKQREVIVSLTNTGSSPELIQAWVDDGDLTVNPGKSKAPFVLTPPMSRVDAGGGQAFRLMFTGADLPKDRESVFWLNVLEIPAKPKDGDNTTNNYLQFAVRSRLKIFFRPDGLPGNPFNAIDQVTWHLVPQGTGYIVECTNPGAFNVSIGSVNFKGIEPEKTMEPKGGMCPAKGSEKFPIKGAPNPEGKLTVQVINDFGGFDSHEVSFTR